MDTLMTDMRKRSFAYLRNIRNSLLAECDQSLAITKEDYMQAFPAKWAQENIPAMVRFPRTNLAFTHRPAWYNF